MSEFGDLLRGTVSDIGFLSDSQIAALEAHYALLQRWNKTINLTAIRTLKEAVIRHYAESVVLAHCLRRFGSTCSTVDIGSGAGFPGIPVAVMLPGWSVTLVESHQRKAVFLRESSRDLPNVTVAARRFDEVAGKYDVAISRAVAWKDFEQSLASRVRHVGLLLSASDAKRLHELASFRWEPLVPMPWDPDSVVLVGST